MARRGKTSPAEDIIDLVAMLPWWVGVVLALVSYLLLHSVASQQVVATAQPGQVGSMVTQTLWKTLASVGQYILPILCLAGAGMSSWRRRARQNLVTDVAQSKATDVLDGVSWREFEMRVGEGFRLQGYQVVETGGGGADGGVDLVLTKPGNNGGEKFLVQCKQWRAFKVGVDVVRSAYFAQAPIEGAVAVGPGLHDRRGWRPALRVADGDARGVDLDDIEGWCAQMDSVCDYP